MRGIYSRDTYPGMVVYIQQGHLPGYGGGYIQQGHLPGYLRVYIQQGHLPGYLRGV